MRRHRRHRRGPVATVLAVSAVAALACGANRKVAVAPRPDPSPVTGPAVSMSMPEAAWKAAFESTIRPMLAERCTPCHQPGGVMYGRLPFDDARTVADAARDRPGFLRRLKGADHEAVEAWIATLPAR